MYSILQICLFFSHIQKGIRQILQHYGEVVFVGAKFKDEGAALANSPNMTVTNLVIIPGWVFVPGSCCKFLKNKCNIISFDSFNIAKSHELRWC